MGVDKKDRDAYERGQRDRNRDAMEIITDPIFHPPPADNPAYDKGKSGERLDQDKKSK